jgi:hypothetical protein
VLGKQAALWLVERLALWRVDWLPQRLLSRPPGQVQQQQRPVAWGVSVARK